MMTTNTLSETTRAVVTRCPCLIPIGPEDLPCGAEVSVTVREFGGAIVGMRLAAKCSVGHLLRDEEQLIAADQVRRGECDAAD